MGNSSLIKMGPWGDRKRNVWDEKGKDKIVQLFIWHDDTGIKSIQFQYAHENNGTLVLSERKGSSDGFKFNVVKLNHPSEYITWISGHHKTLSYDEGLTSVTFGTNRGKYGPFGSTIDSNCKPFSVQLGENRQFGGFHGTADSNGVKSSGVYLKPNMTLDFKIEK